MKEEEFYQKELNLIKEKLSEVKKKININRQKNKKQTINRMMCQLSLCIRMLCKTVS